jgi:hypothetical protein
MLHRSGACCAAQIGIDDRNQFDLVRTLPGGVAALANLSDTLLENGVRVMYPYNPWDTGACVCQRCDTHAVRGVCGRAMYAVVLAQGRDRSQRTTP